MSALASFYLIEQKKIPALVEASRPIVKRTWWGGKKMQDRLGEFLKKESVFLGNFAHSGWVYGEVLSYFDDVFLYKDLELGRYTDVMGFYFFTYQDRENILDHLSPFKLKEEDLQFFAEEYHEPQEEKQECGKILLEAIQLLHNSLQKVKPGQVLFLSIV